MQQIILRWGRAGAWNSQLCECIAQFDPQAHVSNPAGSIF